MSLVVDRWDCWDWREEAVDVRIEHAAGKTVEMTWLALDLQKGPAEV